MFSKILARKDWNKNSYIFRVVIFIDRDWKIKMWKYLSNFGSGCQKIDVSLFPFNWLFLVFLSIIGSHGNKHWSAQRNINTPIGRSRNGPEHDSGFHQEFGQHEMFGQEFTKKHYIVVFMKVGAWGCRGGDTTCQ